MLDMRICSSSACAMPVRRSSWSRSRVWCVSILEISISRGGVVEAATDVFVVLGQSEIRLLLEGEAVEVALEDRFHRPVRDAADPEGPAAGGLEPLGRVPVPEPEQTETGTIALFGVGLALEDLTWRATQAIRRLSTRSRCPEGFL